VTKTKDEKIELKEISLRSKHFRSRELCAVLKHQFRFLNTKIEASAPPSPSSLLPLVLRSPQFYRHQKAKNASNGQEKTYRNACYAGYQPEYSYRVSPATG